MSGILGASVCGVCELHWVLLEARSLRRMSLSVHLKWIEVRATGRKSFGTFGEGFFGTWTIIAVFQRITKEKLFIKLGRICLNNFFA